jgi:hypothetical protein
MTISFYDDPTECQLDPLPVKNYKSNLVSVSQGARAKQEMINKCLVFQNDPVTKLVRSFNNLFGGR